MEFPIRQFTSTVQGLRAEILGLRQAIDAVRNQNERNYQQQNAQRKLPPPLIRIEAKIEEEPAEKSQDNPHRTSHLVAQWVTAVATTLAFIAAAIYAGTAKGQLSQMKTATRATRDAVRLARHNAHLEQRAWVTVMAIEPREGCPWRAIAFQNTGHTPAINFIVDGAAEPIDKGGSPKLAERALPGKGIVAPNSVFASCIGDKSIGNYDWSKSDVVIHGRIIYDDVFKTGHRTKFCYVGSPQRKFSACQDGNEIDANGIEDVDIAEP